MSKRTVTTVEIVGRVIVSAARTDAPRPLPGLRRDGDGHAGTGGGLRARHSSRL